MPGGLVRIVGNTVAALIALSFVVPWMVTRHWPDAVGLGTSSVSQMLVGGAIQGIPAQMMPVYVEASKVDCGMPWWVIAAVWDVESNHANGGRIDASGNTLDRIEGPYIAWLDTHAVGPGQFIPSSWARFGEGDPHNAIDAARATARHLCASSGGRTDAEGIRAGIHGYNPGGYTVDTNPYVAAVMAAAARYSTAGYQPPSTSSVDAVAAFWGHLGQRGGPGGWVATEIGSFWSWVGGDKAPRSVPWAPVGPRGSPDPSCPGRSFTVDGRFHAPPGTTTPHHTAAVARALRARFGVEPSMLRPLADRHASSGAAPCSDHLWGGGLDTSGAVYAWTKAWEGRLFRLVTNDYSDGHTHISMVEDIDPAVLAAFLEATCGQSCDAHATWDPPAQFSARGQGSLALLSVTV